MATFLIGAFGMVPGGPFYMVWSKFGFKLNKIPAWSITFNFINITWVFFSAKEWDDAMKIPSGMFTGTLVLPLE